MDVAIPADSNIRKRLKKQLQQMGKKSKVVPVVIGALAAVPPPQTGRVAPVDFRYNSSDREDVRQT